MSSPAIERPERSSKRESTGAWARGATKQLVIVEGGFEQRLHECDLAEVQLAKFFVPGTRLTHPGFAGLPLSIVTQELVTSAHDHHRHENLQEQVRDALEAKAEHDRSMRTQSLSSELKTLTRGFQVLTVLVTVGALASMLAPSILPLLGALILLSLGGLVLVDFAMRGESIMHPKSGTLFVIAGLGSLIVAAAAIAAG